MSPPLELRGVTKSYGRKSVLRGADLEVTAGALVAVVGENGSGKSTLLKIAAGDLGADSGEVARRGRVGYCPQLPVLNDSLTVDQHFDYFAAAYRLGSLDRVEHLLDLLGFRRFRGDVVGELSGGTRQKLNLALAVMHDPDLLLLDEPYQGFDWDTYLRFWDLVEETRDRGRAVLVITHLVFEEERFDALYRLEDGRARRETAPTKEGGHALT